MPREHELRIFRVIRVFRKAAPFIYMVCSFALEWTDGWTDRKQNHNGIMYGVCLYAARIFSHSPNG